MCTSMPMGGNSGISCLLTNKQLLDLKTPLPVQTGMWSQVEEGEHVPQACLCCRQQARIASRLCHTGQCHTDCVRQLGRAAAGQNMKLCLVWLTGIQTLPCALPYALPCALQICVC